MVENKRKKFHDKDKYYRLAKEQGLRSRAAFKLSQINRKFSILESIFSSSSSPTSREHPIILDLCAAPGGWTQMVARHCPSSPAAVSIIAVDILPIRPLAAHKNVVTLIGDITTDSCQAQITRTIHSCANGKPYTVRLVLHDGAPNVGADYAKDAYVQNELALSALKCTTQHLCVGGTFVTKVYRSRDYQAFAWTLQQLFTTVTAFKPSASRNASAEIFLIGQGYKAPYKLDPKFLDPKHVFASMEDDANVDSTAKNTTTVVGNSKTIFDKSWDKHVRKRNGYDMDHYDATMRHIEPVEKFVAATTSMKDAVQLLSTCTGLSFHCTSCLKKTPDSPTTCSCHFILHHPFTTQEMKEHCADLRVLNKSDFKALFYWRTQMQNAMQSMQEDKEANDPDSNASSSDEDDVEEEDDEELIEKEMEEMRLRRQRERKRQKKKDHEKLQKRRKQMALSGNMLDMDISSNSHPNDNIFSLATIPNAQALDAIREVNIDHVTDEELMIQHDVNVDDDMVIFGGTDDPPTIDEVDDSSVQRRARQMQREQDLDAAYLQYLHTTKNKETVSGTQLAKRSKKLQRHQVMNEIQEDIEMARVNESSQDMQAYAKLLQGHTNEDSDDDDGTNSSKESDDGFAAEPMTPSEFQAQSRTAKAEKNPLVHQLDIPELKSMKTARWFSNPLFSSLGQSIVQATTPSLHGKVDTNLENDGSDSDEIAESPAPKNTQKGVRNAIHPIEHVDPTHPTLTAEEIIASMPKTDKQIRHEKRIKMMERDERKKMKRLQKMGDTEMNELQFVSATAGGDSDSDHEDTAESLDHLSEKQKARVLEARKLIKAGLGLMTAESTAVNGSTIELVPQDSDDVRPLPILDERKYDSDHEDYDSDDHAKTLALGTMMIRRSKEKAFVDASYNRYAWNDPSDLPEWFVDDENKHYRPQLPIPPALLAKMKEKMMALSAKPIAKVAEARARKSKRAKMKLAAAKKQAEAVANSTEMSEAMKLKAISKALTSGNKGDKKVSGKPVVVAKKGRGNVGPGVKGAKVVDKRLKKEKRAMDRIARTKKKGKQNGLTGSKKRRHHK